MTPEIPHWSKDPTHRRPPGVLCRMFGHKVLNNGYRIYCARCDNTLGDSRDGWPPPAPPAKQRKGSWPPVKTPPPPPPAPPAAEIPKSLSHGQCGHEMHFGVCNFSEKREDGLYFTCLCPPFDAAMVRKWIEQNRHGIADAIRAS